MPFVCSVPKCANKRGGHMFPRETDRLQHWLRAIRMESYVPTKHSRVCRNHFTDDDYELPKDSVINDPRPILKKDAVPSIFPWNKVNFKKIAPDSQTNCRNTANVQSTRSHHITNYHFKNKPPDGNQSQHEKKKFKVIPLTLKLPKSQEHTHKPMVNKPEITKCNLDTRTEDPLCSRNDMDLIICEKALEYFKSPSLNQFPTRSKSIPHTNTLPSVHTLPPDVTITRTKPYTSIPPYEPSSFVKPGNNITEIKEVPSDETQSAVGVIIDCNISVPRKISVPIQCNLCQCFKRKNQNIESSGTEKKFCIENVMDVTNPSEVQFFTGFKDYNQFQYVFELLGEDVNHLNYYLHKKTAQEHNLRPCDEFLLTVIKLRRNKLFTELGFRFRTSKELVGIIFTTWINFLFDKFKEISKWMPKDVIDKHMRYGKAKPCLIILECAGIQLKMKEPHFDQFKPTNLKADKSIKVVVEMNDSGSSSCVSEALPGSMSDGELIRKFTFEAKSNINGTENTSSNDETESKINQLKNIEKVIGLSKLYTILNGKMDYMLVPLANQIVFVCFMLTNFIKEPKSEALL